MWVTFRSKNQVDILSGLRDFEESAKTQLTPFHIYIKKEVLTD